MAFVNFPVCRRAIVIDSFFFFRHPRVVSRSQQHRQQCSLGVLFEKQITFKNRDGDVGGSLFLDMANTQKCTMHLKGCILPRIEFLCLFSTVFYVVGGFGDISNSQNHSRVTQ